MTYTTVCLQLFDPVIFDSVFTNLSLQNSFICCFFAWVYFYIFPELLIVEMTDNLFISLGTCKEKCTVLLIRDISFDTTPVCQSGQSIQTFLSVSFSLQKIMLKVKPQDLLKSLYRWTMCIFVVRTYWMLVNNGNCCSIRVTCRLIAVLYQCIFFLRLTESTVQ